MSNNEYDISQDVEPLVTLLDRFSLTRLEYQREEYRIVLERSTPVLLPTVYSAATQSAPCTTAANDGYPTSTYSTSALSEADTHDVANTTIVRTPLVGVAYRSREPGTAPFIIEGSRVEAGDVLCLVEAMKMFNEIAAPVSGVVLAVHFQDGELVEHGAALISIAPTTPERLIDAQAHPNC